jgi:hypothetical protein
MSKLNRLKFAAGSNFVSGIFSVGLALAKKNVGVGMADGVESLADGWLHLNASEGHTHRLKNAIYLSAGAFITGAVYEVITGPEKKADPLFYGTGLSLGVSSTNAVLLSSDRNDDHYKISRLHAFGDLAGSAVAVVGNYLATRVGYADIAATGLSSAVRLAFSVKEMRIANQHHDHDHDHSHQHKTEEEAHHHHGHNH